MEKIVLSPSQVWSYIQNNREELKKEMVEIASNDEYGVVVYVTIDDCIPTVVVQADDIEVYSEGIVSPTDCESTVTKIYDDYLTGRITEIIASMEEEGLDNADLDREIMIEDREAELDDAFYALLATVCDSDDYVELSFDDEMMDDIKEHVLEYIHRKWGVDIRRPMFLEDEDGDEFFEEYPYFHMEFDDEDNPLYSEEV